LENRNQPGDSDPVSFNRKAWDKMALAGDRLYRAVTTEQIAAARDGDWKIRITPQKLVPRVWLEPIEDRKVLCLAAGGGNQAPLLAAAGGRITVFDLSDEQLNRDREIADREGLEIASVAGEMTDLSCFPDDSFDLVINPCSVCFCPSVGDIWSECYRVLRGGGSLITGFINPVYYLFDAAAMDKNQFVVRHKIPYSDFDLSSEERLRLLGPDRPREFGHSLDDLFGKQLEVGFALTGFYEDGWGQNDKLSSLINVFSATRATKLP
jgi:SAM-dependent methyltransferase